MTRAPSWLRTLVLLGIVLDVPLVAPIVRRLTGMPHHESVVIEGIPAELVLPAGAGPWPAFHFVTGAHPERRREPIVQLVAEGLARAGFVAVVSDLPGLGDGELTPQTFAAAHTITRAISERPDVRDGRVALAGASAGAGIALVTAGSPELAARISVVAAVAPFAHIERMACLATTSHYEHNGSLERFAVTALMRRVVAMSFVSAIAHDADRAALLTRLRAQDPDDVTGIRCLEAPDLTLGAEAKAVVRLLLNEDEERFLPLYAALPQDLATAIWELSPAASAARVTAPVEVLAPPDDPYFPLAEAETVADLAPDGRLTVTRVLDHTRPSLTLSRLGDFARFLGWVRRCLDLAAS